MPNNETNTVVIIGAPADIRRFVQEALIDYPAEALGSGETLADKPAKIIDFSRVVPEPENIERGGCSHIGLNRTATYVDGNGNEMVCWYAWNTQNWGTKWGAYSHTHYSLRWFKSYGDDETPYGRVDLRFETAWSQPTPIFEAIQERWGVSVHAVTQDEGGYPDVVFGDPFEQEVMHEEKTFEFDHWATEISEPAAEVTR